MAIQHRVITDPEIHEPKGASTAPSGTVYLSNGSGSGAWGRVKPTTLAGINSDTLGDRVVMTDGAGGFKLETQGGFGFIYSNNNYLNWTAGPLRNVTASGNQLTINVPGYYHITGTYSGFFATDPALNSAFAVRIAVNGANIDARARVQGSGGSGTVSAVQFLGVGSTLVVGISDFSDTVTFANGTLTVTYLGA